jgi:hypothetical protein
MSRILWKWVLLEKPSVAQLLKNPLQFYGTRRFITVLTRALHWSPSWSKLNQSISPHPIHLRSILIIYSHLGICLPSGLFLPGFPTKTYMYSFSLPWILLSFSIKFLFTWWLQFYLAKSTNYKAPYYAIFSNLVLFHPYSVQIFSSAPCS